MTIAVGSKYAALTVVSKAGKRGHDYEWECLCECGTRAFVTGGNLRSGNTRSCGCRRRAVSKAMLSRHLKTGTRIHGVWLNMLRRCRDVRNAYYKDYGGRGITVCDEWLAFENFYSDMGDPPEGMTLDRVDNDKGYCKENCRWASRVEQARNTRKNLFVEIGGVTKTLAEWSAESGLNYPALHARVVKLKWPASRYLEPLRKISRRRALAAFHVAETTPDGGGGDD